MWTLPTMIVGKRIVGGYFDFSFVPHGFLLDHDVFQEVACPGYSEVFLSGLNPLGDMNADLTAATGSSVLSQSISGRFPALEWIILATEWRGLEKIAEVAQARTGQVLTIEAPAPGVGWP
jgi:hypothetical protein